MRDRLGRRRAGELRAAILDATDRTAPGIGASGGLGAGAAGLLGGALHPRDEVVTQNLDLDDLLDSADLVFIAEGSLDDQAPYGKAPVESARRAKGHGLPVIALAGTIGGGAACNLALGIDTFASIVEQPCTREQAFTHAGVWLRHAAPVALRMVEVGLRMTSREAARGTTGRFDPSRVATLDARRRDMPASMGNGAAHVFPIPAA